MKIHKWSFTFFFTAQPPVLFSASQEYSTYKLRECELCVSIPTSQSKLTNVSNVSLRLYDKHNNGPLQETVGLLDEYFQIS